MPAEKLPPPPKPNGADTRHRVEAAIAQTNPVTGVLAAVLDLLAPPLERRRTEWFEQLWEAVTDLQNRLKDFDIDRLGQNEQFITAAIRASRIAIQTHQREMHEALRNAALNAAAGTAPEDDLQTMFLDALDGLTPSHIGLLANRGNHDKPSGGKGLLLRVERVRPPGVGNAMLAQIIRDLRNRGFMEVDTALDQLDAATVGITGVKLTEYGSQFLAFITSPVEKPGVSA